MKKSIGIDIDDTLVKVWHQDIIDNYNKKYNKNLVFDDIITHDFIWDENLKKEFMDYFYANYMSLDLFPMAYDKLLELRDEFDLYLITSRPLSDIELTYEYINDRFWEGFFKDIIFSLKYTDDKKCSLAMKHNFDIVIDDAPHHIINYYNNTSINNIIIFDNPRNRHLSFDDRVTRVKSWAEIKTNLKK